jgi:hypothetical protein
MMAIGCPRLAEEAAQSRPVRVLSDSPCAGARASAGRVTEILEAPAALGVPCPYSWDTFQARGQGRCSCWAERVYRARARDAGRARCRLGRNRRQLSLNRLALRRALAKEGS